MQFHSAGSRPFLVIQKVNVSFKSMFHVFIRMGFRRAWICVYIPFCCVKKVIEWVKIIWRIFSFVAEPIASHLFVDHFINFANRKGVFILRCFFSTSAPVSIVLKSFNMIIFRCNYPLLIFNLTEVLTQMTSFNWPGIAGKSIILYHNSRIQIKDSHYIK